MLHGRPQSERNALFTDMTILVGGRFSLLLTNSRTIVRAFPVVPLATPKPKKVVLDKGLVLT